MLNQIKNDDEIVDFINNKLDEKKKEKREILNYLIIKILIY